MKRAQSEALYKKALNYFPGGVNSPVRAFRSVGGSPLFIEKDDGCHVQDADGNEFVDFCCSWGPLILGHNHPGVREEIFTAVALGTSFGAPTRKENELAELILQHNHFIEKIRFVSSGTEAVMSALRLARGFTGKPVIIKFEGCYHGHVDSLLVRPRPPHPQKSLVYPPPQGSLKQLQRILWYCHSMTNVHLILPFQILHMILQRSLLSQFLRTTD